MCDEVNSVGPKQKDTPCLELSLSIGLLDISYHSRAQGGSRVYHLFVIQSSPKSLYIK